jgi:hypothetical protein
VLNTKRVVEYIRGLGLDPYQLNIKWYTNDNAPLGGEEGS